MKAVNAEVPQQQNLLSFIQLLKQAKLPSAVP